MTYREQDRTADLKRLQRENAELREKLEGELNRRPLLRELFTSEWAFGSYVATILVAFLLLLLRIAANDIAANRTHELDLKRLELNCPAEPPSATKMGAEPVGDGTHFVIPRSAVEEMIVRKHALDRMIEHLRAERGESE